jgi:hypothetical protein
LRMIRPFRLLADRMASFALERGELGRLPRSQKQEP